eukprot:m.89398 g.89398  ORF g.89398 m.89398 type:complete len:273 (+) comp9803_c0_seq1:341-1159(+)
MSPNCLPSIHPCRALSLSKTRVPCMHARRHPLTTVCIMLCLRVVSPCMHSHAFWSYPLLSDVAHVSTHQSPRSSTGAGKSRQSSPSKSPTKSPTKSNGVGGSAGRKSPTKSRTPKSAQGRRSPTKAKSRRNSSVSDAGDSAREKRMFPLDRVREIMREHAGVNRSLSLESQNTMAYAAEQFVYYIAKESLARTGSKSKKNREIDYDSVARAVEDVPTLQAFLSEIVPPRMTFGECEALNAREKEQAAAAAANARANDETNGDDAAEGDDDDD